MPTVTLFPNAVDTNNWTIVGSGDADEVLVDAEYSNYLKTAASGKIFIMNMDNLDFAGLNIDSIDSIQATMAADCTVRSQNSILRCRVLSPSTVLYSEGITVSTVGSITYYPWTSRTTSDGSTAWTDSDIDDILLSVDVDTAPSSGDVIVTQLKLIITYTEVVVPPTKLTLNSGTLNIKGGNLIIKG